MSGGQGVNWDGIFNALGGFGEFLTALAIICGLALFVSGLLRLAWAAQNPRYTVGQGAARMLGGVFLMSIATTVDVFSMSAIGQNASLDFLAYEPPGGGSDTGSQIIRLSVIGIRILGYAIFIRMLWLLARSWDNRHELGPVFTHAIGAVFCINILWFLNVLGITVGGALSSTITRLFG